MRALLPAEHVHEIAKAYATQIAWAIERTAPSGPMARSRFFLGVRDAVEHDLTATLEGLMVLEADAGVFTSPAMRVRYAAAEAGVAISTKQAEHIAGSLDVTASMVEAA